MIERVANSAFDIPGSALLPSLADNEIAGAGERHGVPRRARLEVDVAARLVVLVVVLTASKVGRSRADDKVRAVVYDLRRRCSKHGREGRRGQCEVGKRAHLVLMLTEEKIQMIVKSKQEPRAGG